MSIEVMRQALEALEDAANVLSSRMFPDAAAALRAAIEQAEKPVAFVQAATDQIAPQREWAWMPAPIKTQWGHDMVVADLAIDKDHTVSIYCERDQIKSVEAMFAPQPQQVEKPEPVAWMYDFMSDNEVIRDWVTQSQDDIKRENGFNVRPLYEAPRQWVGLDWFPEHKCGLYLSHNDHRDYYETVEQYYEREQFISDEEWEKAVATDSVWTLQWYPNTPVGFCIISASTLESIEAKLKENNA